MQISCPNVSSRLGSSQCSPPFFPHRGRGFHQPGEGFLSYLGFGLLKRARTLSWNPNGVTFSHSVTHIYADLQARSITVSAPTGECHDLKGMFLLCVFTFFFVFFFTWTVLPFHMFVLGNKIVRSERE